MRRTILTALSSAALLSTTGCNDARDTSAAPTPSVAAPAAAAPAPAAAGPVSALEGEVKLSGAIPKLTPLKTSGNVSPTCAESLPDPSLQAAGDGALAGVIVSVDAPPQPAVGELSELLVDQKGCLYTPVTLAARAGATLTFLNSDPLLHNVRAAAAGRSLFNVAMPLEGLKVKKKLPVKSGTVELRCDVHPWMHAIVKTFDHPHFAVTDAAGRFRIDGVPVGARKVTFWHPRLPELTREVTLSEGAPARLEVSWPAEAVASEPLANGR